MRPANATDANAVFHHWNSPIPYLFGGLALMLGLISLALLILACSFRRSASDSSTTQSGEKPAKEVETQPPLEPGFVVIMPGDDNPKYLAKPVTSDLHVEQV